MSIPSNAANSYKKCTERELERETETKGDDEREKEGESFQSLPPSIKRDHPECGDIQTIPKHY